MKKKKAKIKYVLILAAVFLMLSVFYAQAEGPGSLKAEVGEEGYARIMDHVVEWDEIGPLVKYYNPTYRQYADTADGFIGDMTSGSDSDIANIEKSIETIDENLKAIKEQREKLSKLPGDMVIDARGTTVAQSLLVLDQTEAYLKENRATAKKGIGQVSNSVHSVRKMYEENLGPVRDQLTRVIEGLMITYNQVLISRSMVEKQISLYETLCRLQEDMRAGDMATDADVSAAKATLAEAKASLVSIDNGLSELRRAIGIQTGYSADDPPEIGAVPIPELAKYDGRDKEADRKTALDSNKELERISDLKNYSGTGALIRRDGAENEKLAELTGKFDKLYASLIEQKMLYQTAQLSLRRSQLTRDQAKRQADLGLLGRAEYQARELEVISCEAAVQNAALSYAQAASNYEWALKGYFN